MAKAIDEFPQSIFDHTCWVTFLADAKLIEISKGEIPGKEREVYRKVWFYVKSHRSEIPGTLNFWTAIVLGLKAKRLKGLEYFEILPSIKNSCWIEEVSHNSSKSKVSTVEPCILDQIDHLWGLVVAKPMIQSTKGSNMTLGSCMGLQHVQKSAS